MLTYEDLVSGLEEAWTAAGLHDHGFTESVVPATHERTCKIDLFPEHGEPLDERTMPPWVEISFTWSALHQLRAEGYAVPSEPLDLIWTYNVTVPEPNGRNDAELVRMYQRAVRTAFATFYPADAEQLDPPTVEVHRIYRGERQRVELSYLQLVSMNLTDLNDLWIEQDGHAIRTSFQAELQFVSAIIDALGEVFTPNGRGSYRSVDAA